MNGNGRGEGNDAKEGTTPSKKLFFLLNVSSGEKFDGDAVIREVKRNPSSAGREYTFFFGMEVYSYPLHHAIKLGASLGVVEAIYNSYPQVIKRFESGSGNTALYLACTPVSSPEVAKFLLEKFPHAARVTNRFGIAPIHIACMHQRGADAVSLVSLLLDEWPDSIFLKEKRQGRTPLMCAVLSKWVQASPITGLVPFLLEKWPGAIKEKDSSQSTPLHRACEGSAPLELVTLLLEKWPEAVLEKNYIEHETPLSIAQDKKLPADTYDLLWFVSQICSDDKMEDASTFKKAADFFAQIKWWGGLTMILNKYGHTFTKSLGIDINHMPYLLSFAGRRCKLTTLWCVLANEQDLFKDIA